jgi:hypothetical protein
MQLLFSTCFFLFLRFNIFLFRLEPQIFFNYFLYHQQIWMRESEILPDETINGRDILPIIDSFI